MRTIAAALWLVGVLASTSNAQLVNDTCAAATNVTGLPFTTTVDVTDAVDDPAPPDSSCGISSRNAWFAVHSATAATILVETPDAPGSTDVNVYSGDCGSLVEVGCDGQSSGHTAKVLVPIASGQTLYIAVSGDSGAIPVRITTAPIDTTPPTVVAAVLTGDSSPLGGAFSGFGTSVMVTPELVAFTGTTEGVFADLGSGVETVAMSGDPAPGGGTFSAVGPPVIDAAGNVFFVANVDRGPSSAGIFRRSGSTTTVLVRSGDLAPNGVTRFERISRRIAVNGAGDLVFTAGSSRWDDAIYVMTGGVVSGPMLQVFDWTPCGEVNRLGSSRRSLAINSAGEIAVYIRTFSPLRAGIVRIAGGVVSTVACEDDPTPFGGTYRTVNDALALGEPPSSTIVFRATTTSSTSSARILRQDLWGTASVVAKPGDVATGGETISALPTTSLTLDGSGAIGFVARVGTRAAVVVQPAAVVPPTVVTTIGASCPSGELVRSVSNDLAGDELGTLLVGAACANSAGVFTTTVGGSLTTAATDATTTTIGPGLIFGSATMRSGRMALRGSRTAVYQRHCQGGTCGDIEALASQYDPLPGVAGERIWDIDTLALMGRRGQVVFTAGTLAGHETVLAARHGTLRTVAVTDTPLAGTTFTPTALREVGASTDGNAIAFVATGTDATDGLEHTGVLLARHGRFQTLARASDPVVVGGEPTEFWSFGIPLVKGRTVTVYSSLDIADCWMELRGKNARPLICNGDGMPEGGVAGPIDLTFGVTGALSNRGLVVPVRGSNFLEECLLAARRGRVRPVACTDDPLPGGGTAVTFTGSELIAATGARIVASVQGSSQSGLFAFGDGRLALVAKDDSSPVGSSGRWSVSAARPSIQGSVVSFDAVITGGTHSGVIALAQLAR